MRPIVDPPLPSLSRLPLATRRLGWAMLVSPLAGLAAFALLVGALRLVRGGSLASAVGFAGGLLAFGTLLGLALLYVVELAVVILAYGPLRRLELSRPAPAVALGAVVGGALGAAFRFAPDFPASAAVAGAVAGLTFAAIVHHPPVA